MVLVIDIWDGCLEALHRILPFESLVAKYRTSDRSSRNHCCSRKLCLMRSTLALDPGCHSFLYILLYCMRDLIHMRSDFDCGDSV